jgi:hypothetical protein
MCVQEKLNSTDCVHSPGKTASRCILRSPPHVVHQEDAKVTFSLKVFSKQLQGSIGY